jgi:hypothetical protein
MRCELILRIALGLAVCVIGWVGLTLFFFGSAHPCGILENRQRSTMEQLARRAVIERIEEIVQAMVQGRSDYARVLDEAFTASGGGDLNVWVEKALADNHKDIWRRSPYECLRGAIRWKPPK